MVENPKIPELLKQFGEEISREDALRIARSILERAEAERATYMLREANHSVQLSLINPCNAMRDLIAELSGLLLDVHTEWAGKPRSKYEDRLFGYITEILYRIGCLFDTGIYKGLPAHDWTAPPIDSDKWEQWAWAPLEGKKEGE